MIATDLKAIWEMSDESDPFIRNGSAFSKAHPNRCAIPVLREPSSKCYMQGWSDVGVLKQDGLRVLGRNLIMQKFLVLLLSGVAIAVAPSQAVAQERASPALEKHGGDGGGRTTRDALDPDNFCALRRGRRCDINLAIERGLFETGLRPRFPDHVECRGLDEHYAISYTHKRPRESYHGGIDMPAPWGTPMIAAAAGTVVGVFSGDRTPRGVELVLRHSPDDTGLALWIYTQYTHFDAMPKQQVGQRVRMGEVLGPTGNSGISVRTGEQSRRRRPAIHFGVFYSTSEKYFAGRRRIIPVDGHWMDPNALYRNKLPLDSHAMKALPEAEKQVAISYMLEDGRVFPAGAKFIWPYRCKRR